MNCTKPQREPPRPLIIGFLTAAFVLILVGAGLLLLGLRDVMTHPALIGGAATFVFAVLATAIRGQWWQRKQRRTTGSATRGQNVPEHLQRKMLPMALSMLAGTLAMVAFIVLPAIGYIARNGTVIMTLGVIGLAPAGFLLFIATYGYLADTRDQ